MKSEEMSNTREDEKCPAPLRSFLIEDILKHSPKKPRSKSPVNDLERSSPREGTEGGFKLSTSSAKDGSFPPIWSPASWPYTCTSRVLDRRATFGPFLFPNHPHQLIPHYYHHHIRSSSPATSVPFPPGAPGSNSLTTNAATSSNRMDDNHSISQHLLNRQLLMQHGAELRDESESDCREEDGEENDYSSSDATSDISITGSPSPSSKKRTHHNDDQGCGNSNNSPLDALFALTTKALDRVNTKSSDSHSKNMYKDGMSQVKKKRKSRTAFTNTQIFELEKRFLYQKYLSPADRDELASGLGLTGAQVITWFQNRRAKLKRDVEEIKKDVEATKMNFGVPPTPSPLTLAGYEHDSFAVSKKAAELRVLMHLEQINQSKR